MTKLVQEKTDGCKIQGCFFGSEYIVVHRVLIGRVTTRAEDARGTPTQSHILPSIPGYKGKTGEND